MTLATYAPLLVRLAALDGSLLAVDTELEDAGLLDGLGLSAKGEGAQSSLRRVAEILGLELSQLPPYLNTLSRRIGVLLGAASVLPTAPLYPELSLTDDAGLTLRGRRLVDELARLALLLDVPLA